MRYLDVRIRQPDWMLHPMQSFIRHEDVVQYEELLTWNVQREQGIEYELFYVEADREQYEPAIDAVDSIHWYDLTPVDDGSFYIYACQDIRDIDVEWREAFVALNLLVLPPIVYDTEAAMRMTVIGSSEDLQTMLDGLPDEIDVTVNEIGEFDARHPRLAGSMTARQREAVSLAVDLGYYDVPRTGSLEAVADALDCAPSTASNHLRKAEAAVMRRLVEGDRRD
ncbi:helix-turn-helix domain-containing protein [Haloarchaeobius sp. TZWSO28]|uniref:helix-turn-helix domain-containing protein n=1 Tax=Haloarchaeobius sp. TZWSO28 TaxID=3446119 RepID=UPI003EBE7252